MAKWLQKLNIQFGYMACRPDHVSESVRRGYQIVLLRFEGRLKKVVGPVTTAPHPVRRGPMSITKVQPVAAFSHLPRNSTAITNVRNLCETAGKRL